MKSNVNEEGNSQSKFIDEVLDMIAGNILPREDIPWLREMIFKYKSLRKVTFHSSQEVLMWVSGFFAGIDEKTMWDLAALGREGK